MPLGPRSEGSTLSPRGSLSFKQSPFVRPHHLGVLLGALAYPLYLACSGRKAGGVVSAGGAVGAARAGGGMGASGRQPMWATGHPRHRGLSLLQASRGRGGPVIRSTGKGFRRCNYDPERVAFRPVQGAVPRGGEPHQQVRPVGSAWAWPLQTQPWPTQQGPWPSPGHWAVESRPLVPSRVSFPGSGSSRDAHSLGRPSSLSGRCPWSRG